MKKIVVDLLNNDGGEEALIEASLKFAFENKDYFLYLVGHEELIKKINTKKVGNIQIFNSTNLIHIESSPREVLRQESSMLEAFNVLKNEDADAIISSGDSGAFTSLSFFKIERLHPEIKPAFMPVMATVNEGQKMLLLDAGANLDVTSETLINWAKIATLYYKLLIENKEKITVGLLNIGSEDYKGSLLNQETNKNFKISKNNFIYEGFLEPDDAIKGKVDIVVTNGISGNIFLKTMESSFLNVLKLLKGIFYKNLKNKFAALLLKKDLKKFKERYDYRNTGGAYIAGLNKVVVKAHGSSDSLAFYSALQQVKNAIEKNLTEVLKKEIEAWND
ncbi:phosphate:acyl-[acyl carrier protein] acyltransferase [Metamycoplasma subdolum]|uniref:Phosphate acyltransferase n=1 Tax=Metamycoplasma subdolum TaxID=92407 RepID=A0A3M0A075_9BACT|nr:phosphate acyltransferase PlsX [Metamycoplasma subdolum]RMA78521.1 phosphate:acyl-[acyl carrier protein] acyltransferase [Metamycoplasma subdolum]WPB50453.1 phosphate acyltransferase PlsX [Metamycoplasma subdolum]